MKTQHIWIILVTCSVFAFAQTAAQESSYNYATGQVFGRDHVGGLVGGNEDATAQVSNSYSRCMVQGEKFVGGFIGTNTGLILNSYAAGVTTGGSVVGGFGGLNAGSVSYSYWDMQLTGQNLSDGGLGRTTDDMTLPYASNTFVNWDFETIWAPDMLPWANDGYPLLQSSHVYRLVLKVFPGGSGTVTGAGYYKANTEVPVEASASPDYSFQGWKLDGSTVSTDQTFEYALTRHTSLTAVFGKTQTSVEDQIASPDRPLKIYPNPVQDLLTIEFAQTAGEMRCISIVNIFGQYLHVLEFDPAGPQRFTFDVSGMVPGIYLFVSEGRHDKQTVKVVIQ